MQSVLLGFFPPVCRFALFFSPCHSQACFECMLCTFWHVMWAYECKTCLGVIWENIDEANGQTGGKNRNSAFECTTFISFPFADLTFNFSHCPYLYNYYNYSRTLWMLSFRISYWDLLKLLNFGDTTERGYRGWKQAQTHYDITDNQSCVFFLGH
jgi:hypothetical protein